MGADIFVTADFLLAGEPARRLYHEYAEELPIIDYHCHLPPRQVAHDHLFENLTQIWLYGDHYKWRAMRAAGVAERFCSRAATDWEKFQKWAETVPQTLRNPLYHWTHLELKRPFGISDRLLNPDTAKGIWDECNAKLATPEFSCRGIMRQMRVALVCTTDDPADTLEHHRRAADDPTFNLQMLPTWRPDQAMAVESADAYNVYLDRLGAIAGVDISNLDSLLSALRKRHDFFHETGCRLSDHGLETAYATDCTEAEARCLFAKVRGGKSLDTTETEKLKAMLLHEFAVMDWEKGWTQQFHFGALRDNRTRLLQRVGPNTGFDSIGDFELARPLSKMLDRLDREEKLAQTILYNLNPRDNELLATMAGNFQDDSVAGKVQFGSAWWFLDQKDGMEKQLNALSNLGLLSCFVGMLTDSRSFLSYTRHEYFRRILCNLLGGEMAAGLLPNDMALVGGLVRKVCYDNAAAYFGFNL